jgi:hypothetical protein
MAVTAKCLLEAKYAENSETTQYSAGSGVRTIVDKFTATNVTASAATITVKVIASGGTASTDETIVKEKSLAAGETYTFPEMVGQVLNAGDFISTLAGTATAIVIRISGRENT